MPLTKKLYKTIQLGCLFLLILTSACSIPLQNSCEQDFREIDYDNDIYFSENDSLSRYYYLKAEMLLKEEKLSQAQELLQKASDLNEKPSPTILRRLTQLYLKSGDLEKALNTTELLLDIDKTSVEDLQLKAGTLGAMGRSDESIKVYREILDNLENQTEEPYLLLAGIFLQRGEKDQGLKVLEELLGNIPESFLGHYYSGKLHASNGDLQLAIKSYEKALEQNPMADNVRFEYIQILALDGQVEKATSITKEILERRPDNEKARKFLTELLLGEDKVEEAIKEYEKANSQKKGNDNLQFKVALIKLQKRDFRGAESEFNLLLTKDPNYHKARYYLATTYASQERIDEAITQLNLIPETENVLFKKSRALGALLYQKEENYDDAISFLNEGLELYPDDPELLSFEVSVLRSKGALDKVVEVQNKLHLLEPENDNYLFNLGVAYDEAGNREKALQVMEELIQRNPNHANALNYLAYSLSEEGKDLERAKALIKKALEIEPNNGFFIDSLGWILYQQEKYQEALPYLERANDLVADDPVIMEHLGRVRLKLGQTNRAKSILRKAYEVLENDPEQKKLKDSIKELLESLNK